MVHFGGGMLFPFFGIFGFLSQIVLVVLVIAFIVYLVKPSKHRHHLENPKYQEYSSALKILQERFAKDEITEEEYERKKEILKKM